MFDSHEGFDCQEGSLTARNAPGLLKRIPDCQEGSESTVRKDPRLCQKGSQTVRMNRNYRKDPGLLGSIVDCQEVSCTVRKDLRVQSK